jgi:hypothetical protein
LAVRLIELIDTVYERALWRSSEFGWLAASMGAFVRAG